MLTNAKKLFLLVMVAFFALFVVACKPATPEEPEKTDEDLLVEALEKVTLPQETDYDLILPSSISLEGATLAWTSESELVEIDGYYAVITRPSVSDKTAKFTATATKGEITKTKDFSVVIKKLLAPEEIAIDTFGLKVDELNEGQYLLKKGETVKLDIIVEDEEQMSKEVIWSITKGSKYASLSEDGELKGTGYGKVIIEAVSTSKNAAGANPTATITFEIVEDYKPTQVLLNNKKYIEDIMAEEHEFVYESFTLPELKNEEVEVTYYDSYGDEIWNGEYEYVEDVDHQETILCELAYRGEVTEFSFVIKVVSDPNANEFLALEYAKEQIDAIFQPYLDGEKFAGTIDVPTAFAAEDALFDVEVSYDEVTDYNPNPIKFAETEVTEGEETTVIPQLVYTKPNDDAPVRIEVYCKTENNDAVYRYNITAAGYTKEEIVEYVKASSLPQANEAGAYELVAKHITLAQADTTGKFGSLAIEWTSSDETLLTSAGKFANPFLTGEANVTLTAKITYGGTVNETFAFEEELTYEFTLKEAANKAQSVALQLSSYVETEEFLNKISWFPFGDQEREGGDVLPLPKKVSDVAATEMAEYADLDITWTCSEADTLDENYRLLKQYLRYHEVVLTYAVTVEGIEATNEITINIGLAEKRNTIYIGGNFYQQSGGGDYTGDALAHLSKFDAAVGVLASAATKWGYSYGHGEFAGYTFYVDKTDEETGKTTRYQYYTTMGTLIVLDNDYTIDTATGAFTLGEHTLDNVTTSYGGNWAIFFVNTTDHDVVVPMSPYTGGDTPFADNDGDGVNDPWIANPHNIGRENAFSFDGYRTGFVTDAEGVVVFGNGEGKIQAIMDQDGDGKMSTAAEGYADFFITIPAGGYGMTHKTQNNNATITGKFCVVGEDLHMKYYLPYSLSEVCPKNEDGTPVGFNEYVTPIE